MNNIIIDLLHFLSQIERPLGIIAGILIATAQLSYVVNIFRKQVKPSPLSWYGWTALMGTSLIAQILSKGWQWSLTGLSLSAFGCFMIGTFAIVLKHFSLKKQDWNFVFLGVVCIGIYLLSDNPWYTTGFAILADLMLSMPTFIKAYHHPQSEKSAAWVLGLCSWSITLITCIDHNWLYAMFPMYLFLFNLAMIVLTRRNQPVKEQTG